MTREEKLMAAVGAKLDGEAAVARELGQKVELSEMEVILLSSMAYLGAMMVIREDGTSAEAEELIAETKESIETHLGQPGRPGMNRLAQGVVALLTQDRLSQYIVNNH